MLKLIEIVTKREGIKGERKRVDMMVNMMVKRREKENEYDGEEGKNGLK